MKRSGLGLWLLCAMTMAAQGCPCGGSKIERPYPQPTVDALLQQVRSNGQVVSSYVAESTMDYWVGDERIKMTVYVMGKRGARIRFNAINPATETTASDLGCDGNGFAFLDYEKECQLSGVCDQYSIAQLLRVRLDPDDFLLLAVGSTPIVNQPEGVLRWDHKRGAEVLDLVERGGARRQTLVLSGKQGQWDVLESAVYDASGKLEWKLENKGFSPMTTEDGKSLRVPRSSHFEQPAEKADLVARWDNRTLNLELDEDKFVVPVPAELKLCPTGKAAPPAPAPDPDPTP